MLTTEIIDELKKNMLSNTYNLKIENESIYISFIDTINNVDLLENLKIIYDLEANLYAKNEKFDINLNLKNLSIELITKAISFSLKYENLADKNMILNIINLIKIYNTLDDSFFIDDNIYFNSIEDFIDLKLELKDELEAFIRQLSIYFISLFKSYNKLTYTPQDTYIKLPNVYSIILLSLDFLTLSGIFSISKSFSTNECVYIENSLAYITTLLQKNILSIDLMNSFFGKHSDDNINR